MFRARGKLLLFADADGATTFSDFCKVETSIRNLCKGKSISTTCILFTPIMFRAHSGLEHCSGVSYLNIMPGFKDLLKFFLWSVISGRRMASLPLNDQAMVSQPQFLTPLSGVQASNMLFSYCHPFIPRGWSSYSNV